MKARWLCGFSLVLVACSSGATSVSPSFETGGTSSVGGSASLGGTTATANPSSGGATTAAGSLYGGAANSTGGATNGLGGMPFAGGASNNVGTGGTSETGGTVSAASFTGGAMNGSGGVSPNGGTSNAFGTGGVGATGGAFSVGGNVGSGGLLGFGGTLATGGAATGGTSVTGVVATGGGPTATGGTTATGGSGGAVTSGAATGGMVATGGAATGGMVATGGSACTPVYASSLQYVDPSAGTDDDQHGAAFGACAYKSLTYALTRATGQIALQSGTYTSATETFPIVLTGSQQLLCKYSTATSAVIQGKGMDTTGDPTTIALRGSHNELRNCKIDGNGTPGYCVHVTFSGSYSSPHTITGSDIGYCGNAAITVRYANNVTVTSSNIHNNQTGVSWLGPNTAGSMLNNTFKANSIADIQCSVPDPGVTGSGNTALGVLYCSQCGNCPF